MKTFRSELQAASETEIMEAGEMSAHTNIY